MREAVFRLPKPRETQNEANRALETMKELCIRSGWKLCESRIEPDGDKWSPVLKCTMC